MESMTTPFMIIFPAGVWAKELVKKAQVMSSVNKIFFMACGA
jgi:hypothetical protein